MLRTSSDLSCYVTRVTLPKRRERVPALHFRAFTAVTSSNDFYKEAFRGTLDLPSLGGCFRHGIGAVPVGGWAGDSAMQ